MSIHVRHPLPNSPTKSLGLSLAAVFTIAITAAIASQDITISITQKIKAPSRPLVHTSTEPPTKEEGSFKIDMPLTPQMEEPTAICLLETTPNAPAMTEAQAESIDHSISACEPYYIINDLFPAELAEEEPPKHETPRKKEEPQHRPHYQAPQYAKTPHPPYPKVLVRQKIKGAVRVRIHINSEGKATAVDILESPHKALAESTQKTILTAWLFKPAELNGRRVASTATTTIHFQ